MMRRPACRVSAFALLLAFAAPADGLGQPPRAAPRPGPAEARRAELDRAFEALKAAPDEAGAALVEGRIRALWAQAASPAATLLLNVVHSPSGAAVLAFALVFGITFFGGKLVASALGQRTKKSVLGSVDRVLGLGFGGLKGLLIATVLFLGVNLVFDTIYGAGSQRPEFIRASRTYPLLNASGRAVIDWVQHRRAATAANTGKTADLPRGSQ